ncbi:MAG: beta-propeller domain-containing protein [Candidatus Izemoplasmatales bacterium]
MKRILIGALLLFLSVGLFSCDEHFEAIDYKEVDSIGQFENYGQIRDYLDRFYEDKGYSRELTGNVDYLMTSTVAMTTMATQNSPESAALDGAEKSHSESNDQVAGVKEADRILTDGDTIYVMTNQALLIIDPEAMTIVDSFQYTTDGYLSGMYKYGDYVVLLGSEYHYEWTEVPTTQANTDLDVDDDTESRTSAPYYYGYMRYRYGTRVIVLDISNKQDIVKSKELYFEGSYLTDSRMIDNQVYLVMNNYAGNFGYGSDEETFIPAYYDSTHMDEIETMPARDIYYMPNNFQSWSFLLLASFAVDDDEAADVKAYLGSTYDIYMSLDNLYAIVNRYKVNDVSGFYEYETFVIRFAVEDGQLVYRATGTVPGSPLNQFSMDEYDGTFRIATTDTKYRDTGFTIANALYIFDATSEDTMEQIGSLTGLGKPGERIFAARFSGPQALIVTFVQTDPLYKIDLTDPEHPEVVGELYEEGVSDYLHPLTEDLSLGVGRQAETVDGFTTFTGVKVALYDISADDPVNLETYLVEGEYSYSPVQYDHKAFVSYEREGDDFAYVAIPVYEWHQQYYQSSQSVYVFKAHFVGDLEYLTKLTHMPEVQTGPDEYYYNYYDSIERTLMIENMIYTVSYSRIQKYDMDQDFVLVDALAFD